MRLRDRRPKPTCISSTKTTSASKTSRCRLSKLERNRNRSLSSTRAPSASARTSFVSTRSRPAEEPAAESGCGTNSPSTMSISRPTISAPVEAEVCRRPKSVAAEPDLGRQVEPDPAPPSFEISLPPYDAAQAADIADGCRCRGVPPARSYAAAPAEPEFNLEDELNALLGNIKSNQAGRGQSWARARIREPARLRAARL